MLEKMIFLIFVFFILSSHVYAVPSSNYYDYGDEGKVRTRRSIPCTLSEGITASCQPFGICAGRILDVPNYETSDECKGEGSSFVCCPEKTANDVDLNAVTKLLGSAEDQLSPVTSIPEDMQNIVDREWDVAQERLEESRSSGANMSLVTRAHQLFSQAREKGIAEDVDKFASELREVADNIITDAKTDFSLNAIDFNVRTLPRLKDKCPWTSEEAPECTDVLYRSFDGSCNNLINPNFGRADTPYQRLLPAVFEGNFTFSLPRGSLNATFTELPSARLLSTSLTIPSPEDTESEQGLDGVTTTIVMQMGQFIDHDTAFAPMFNLSCCPEDDLFESINYEDAFRRKKCFPIEIPQDDPFFDGRKTCMALARSMTAPNLDCRFGPMDQVNQITHWLDNSNIYGSNEEEIEELREGSFGLLKVQNISTGTNTHAQFLPGCLAFDNAPSTCNDMCDDWCFVAGDERANEQINLLTFHTIWLREHNRVAKALNKLNSNWDDETLFQESRRIVNAQYQHIIYNEWLPLVLGRTNMDSFNLWPISKGHSDAYLNTIDPRVTNEFGAAAFRFGHSLIPHFFKSGGKTENEQKTWILRETFFQPNLLSGLINGLTEGLFSQNGQSFDNQFATDITNHLFAETPESDGLDLIALNIQRGRDHGLPGYIEYRKLCKVGEKKATTWEDFEDYIDSSNVAKLKEIYRDVDDVDLFVGGILERPVSDSPLNVGPTFICIIGDTFARLRMGDRFFYDISDDRKKFEGDKTLRFTAQQIESIRNTSMARILCDNSDIDQVQPQAFRMKTTSRHNIKRSCTDLDNIPKVDLGLFLGGQGAECSKIDCEDDCEERKAFESGDDDATLCNRCCNVCDVVDCKDDCKDSDDGVDGDICSRCCE